MQLFLKNTSAGLIPLYDEGYENKRKLKIGETYKVKITKARNVGLHRKYFALISCAWEYLNESQTKFFGENKEQFRKTIEIAAGHCDTVFSLSRREWVEVPKSISFEKMDELQFRELYDRCKDVIFGVFLKHISIEEFEKELINF